MMYFQAHARTFGCGKYPEYNRTTPGREKDPDQNQSFDRPFVWGFPESLEFWFSEIVKEKGFGTPVLEIKKPKASAVCAQCKNTYEVKSFYSGCPQCGNFERTVSSGYECVIDSIEIEMETE